ncbi:MAG: hypothetical protein AB7E95_08635 [Kiritimatiellales bacterium]
MDGWNEFMGEGDAYLKTACGGRKRPAVFTPEILYNLLAMAIEKHVMAVLMFNNSLADNHTFTDLIESARTICPLDEELAQKLIKYESYQEICPVFDGYNRDPFPPEEIPGMTDAAEQVQQWAKKQVAS